MPHPGLFWPTNRTLFRRRSPRWVRAGLWVLFAVALVCGAIAIVRFR